jgi:hypothetical protein
LSQSATFWIGVGVALLGIGSQFSDYRNNWLTLAFTIAAIVCFFPAFREWMGWNINIRPETLSVVVMGIVGFVLFSSVAWIYQRHSEISAVNSATDTATMPATSAPAPIPKPKTPSAEWTMVPGNVTPNYLGGFYDQHTKIQADKLAAPYIGKGIIVSGPVGDVREYDRGMTVFIEISSTNKVLIPMEFDIIWRDHVSILTKNTQITVRGQIKSIRANELILHHCELLKTPES